MATTSVANEMSVRRYPRVPLATPVEIRTGDASMLGKTENVSLGGLLVQCSGSFAPNTELDVLLNLPTGHSIRARCEVVHLQPASRMGLRFLDLPEVSRQVMADFIRELMAYTRRGGRVCKRLNVSLRGPQKETGQEELAETVVVSQHGGLLVTRAKLEEGDSAFLWWPGGQRGTEIRIVFSRLSGTGGLLELGFEFQNAGNFWGFDFPAED